MPIRCFFLLICVLLAACNGPNPAVAPSSAAQMNEAAPAAQTTRFIIVQSGRNDPSSILLDTTTGQTWLLVTPPNGPAAWVQIYRPPAAQSSN